MACGYGVRLPIRKDKDDFYIIQERLDGGNAFQFFIIGNLEYQDNDIVVRLVESHLEFFNTTVYFNLFFLDKFFKQRQKFVPVTIRVF